MNLNENTTINGSITVKDANNNEVVVATATATIDKSNMSITQSVYTSNSQLAITNASTVKAQYDEFQAAVVERATQLGIIFLTGVTPTTAATTTAGGAN